MGRGKAIILSLLLLLTTSVLYHEDSHGAGGPIVRVLILTTPGPVTIRGKSAISFHATSHESSPSGIDWEKYGNNGCYSLPLNLIRRYGPIRVIPGISGGAVNGKHFNNELELHWQPGDFVHVIKKIPLEDYLPGVIEAEIPAIWPLEVKKAQAVAARTYTLWKICNSTGSRHLVAGVQDQAFKSSPKHDPSAIRAVNETRGIYMAKGGKPILAYYHSCCGGRTDSALAVKGRRLDYISPVDCPWCKNAPRFKWEYEIPVKNLGALLSRAGYQMDRLQGIKPVGGTPGNRVSELELETPGSILNINAEDLRRIIGYRKLRSAKFKISVSNRKCRFIGAGYGHGLGACQYGMKGMADAGKTWKQMLRFYYEGVEFKEDSKRLRSIYEILKKRFCREY